MSWVELTIHVTHEAVDWVSTSLAAIAYAGEMQIADYAGDAQAEEQTQWALTIYLYWSGDRPLQSQLNAIDTALSPLYRVGLATLAEITELEEKPAVNSPIQQGHRVGRFLILPANASDEGVMPNDIPLRLETSLAFGSGLHPATQLSLQLLERYVVPGIQVLDLGAGTGILSVAMAKLGAQVTALDNDLIAVQATQANALLNGVADPITVMQGSLGGGNQLGHWMGGEVTANVSSETPTSTFDLIVANILARIHIALAPDFRQALRRPQPNLGVLITAGFTVDYRDEIEAALIQSGFEAIANLQQEEWIAFAHRLKA